MYLRVSSAGSPELSSTHVSLILFCCMTDLCASIIVPMCYTADIIIRFVLTSKLFKRRVTRQHVWGMLLQLLGVLKGVLPDSSLSFFFETCFLEDHENSVLICSTVKSLYIVGIWKFHANK